MPHSYCTHAPDSAAPLRRPPLPPRHTELGNWLFENSPDCIKLLDCGGRLVRMNRNGQCALEIEDFEALVGMPWHRLWPDATRERVRQSVGNALEQGSDRFQAFCPTAKGAARWWDVTVTPVLDQDGMASHLLSVSRDITEVIQAQKREQAALRALNERLEEQVLARTHDFETSMLELEALWHALAHDLRAPLAAVDGFARALSEQEGIHLGEPGSGFVEKIRSRTLRMERMIQGILDLAELSEKPASPQVFDVSACARQTLQRLAEGEAGRQVEWQVQDGLVAWGDRFQLRVMLEQLLANAWKFTSGCPRARIEVGRERVDGEDALFVRDNGAGFDTAYARRLFRPFQRLHNEAEFPGIGIGLALVFKVAALHRGRAWAKSTSRQGATFYIALPPAPGMQVAAVRDEALNMH